METPFKPLETPIRPAEKEVIGYDTINFDSVTINATANIVITPDSPQVGKETVQITVDAANAQGGRLFGRLRGALD